LHGGQVRVQARQPQGLCFVIEIPFSVMPVA
jgi:signal transduction histidine kinase